MELGIVLNNSHKILVFENLYFAVGHGQGKMVLRLLREELPHSKIKKLLLVIVLIFVFFVTVVLNQLGIPRKRVFQHHYPLQHEIQAVGLLLAIQINNLSVAVGHFLYLID